MQLTTRLVLAVALALSACGDDDDDDDVIEPDAAAPGIDAAPDPDASSPDAPAAALGPVTNLQAGPDAATGIDVSWTNPTDASFAGVLIVRAGGADVTFDPVDGTTYSVDDDVGGGQTVVFAGAGTALNYADPVPGLSYTFRAWAYDTNNTYSTSAAAVGVNNNLPTQTATLEVAVATPGVTVVTQPPHFNLAGTASYDGGTQTLTVSLGVENQTGRVVFNAKTVIDSVGEGTAGGPTLGGLPYAYYGPEALAIGTPVSRDIVITGVTGGTDPVTVDLHIVDAPMLITGNQWDVRDSSAALVDLGAGVVGGAAACDGNIYTLENANGQGACNWRPGVLSPDARAIYVGHRALPLIRRIDTTTMATTAMTDLAPKDPIATVDNVSWRPNDQKLYAVLNVGGHAYNDSKTDVMDGYLVRIDPATLMEEERVQLYASPAEGSVRARGVEFSPDGSIAAVPIQNIGRVALVDVATMTLIDTDAVTAGVQRLDVSGSSMIPKQVAFSPDGAMLYVGHRSGGGVDHLNAFDMSTYVDTPVAATDVLEVGGMGFDGMGRLWVTRLSTDGIGLTVFDLTATPVTQTDVAITEAGANEDGNGFGFSPDGTTAYVASQDAVEVTLIDVATMTPVDQDGDAGNGLTNLPLTDSPGQHRILVTPF